jgi:hypothetical protein
VVRGADEQRVAIDAGQLQRLEPDVELEVRDVAAQLGANAVPYRLELIAHGSIRPSRTCSANIGWRGLGGGLDLGVGESTLARHAFTRPVGRLPQIARKSDGDGRSPLYSPTFERSTG